MLFLFGHEPDSCWLTQALAANTTLTFQKSGSNSPDQAFLAKAWQGQFALLSD